MAPFFSEYVNTTRIAPDEWSVQASLPRGNIYIKNCTHLKSMNCDQNV